MLKAFKYAPVPVTALILSFIVPTELSLYLGDIRFSAHRLVLFFLVPVALSRILTRPDTRLHAFDAGIILFGIWLLFSYTWHAGNASGFIYGGSQALETVGAYLVARAWVRDQTALKAALNIVFIAVFISAACALPEMLLGKIFVHDFMAKVTGIVYETSVKTRLGLTRAYSFFDHPIHYGTFCAALLALFWYVNPQISQRIKIITVVTFAVFLSVSSAPLMCILIQFALITGERVTRGISGRVWLAFALAAAGYLVLAAVSTRSPIAVIATRLTIDSWTGLYRLLIWEYGLQSVWANPWLGIGLADWQRLEWMHSDSIDSFWLVTAMRSGLPSFFILAGAILLLAAAAGRKGSRSQDALTRRLSAGWLISLTALCFIGATVHFWNVLQAYFFFFLGLGGWLADPIRATSRTPRRRTNRRPRASALAQPPGARTPGVSPGPDSEDWMVPNNGRVIF